MRQKDENKVIKIVLFILILVIVSLLVYYAFDKKNKNTIVKSNDIELKKIDDKKEYVYNNPKYNDKSIPYVNLNSEDAKKINNQIEKYVDNEAKNEWNDLSYKYYINKNIVSILLVNRIGDTDNRKYKVYNIDINTGKKVTNKEILNIKKMNMNDVSSNLKETIENSYGENISFAKENNIKNDNPEIDSTIYEANKNSCENLKIDSIKIFLNERQELCIVHTIYNIAGAMISENIYNLDTKNRLNI